MTEGEIPVFVYGSLMRRGEYHHLMQQSKGRFMGEARLTKPYPLEFNDYPCLIDRPGDGVIVPGELYLLPDEQSLAILDELEGHPDEYRRRPEPVLLGGETLNAWVYFYTL